MEFIKNNFWILYGIVTAISLIGGIYVSIKEDDKDIIEIVGIGGVIPGFNLIVAAVVFSDSIRIFCKNLSKPKSSKAKWLERNKIATDINELKTNKTYLEKETAELAQLINQRKKILKDIDMKIQKRAKYYSANFGIDDVYDRFVKEEA